MADCGFLEKLLILSLRSKPLTSDATADYLSAPETSSSPRKPGELLIVTSTDQFPLGRRSRS